MLLSLCGQGGQAWCPSGQPSLGSVLFLVLIHDLCHAMQINLFPCKQMALLAMQMTYSSGSLLSHRAMVAYMATNYMVPNLDKTKILWVGLGNKSLSVAIGHLTLKPVKCIEVLGLKFNRKLKLDPHIQVFTLASAAIASTARSLTVHLPSGTKVEVVRALLVGKERYRAAAAT